jgi:hypothetical protein
MTDRRDQSWTGNPDDDLATEGNTEAERDRATDLDDSGESPGGTANRPAGPDYGEGTLDDDTPGSQGEIEAGSEGDFGDSRR